MEEAHKNVLRKSQEITGTAVKGYDFNQGVDYEKIIDSFSTTGFQATHLAKAISIIRKMREEKCTLYLGFTSNMTSSGLRDVFRYLVQHSFVDVIVTTAGSIEEDIIKCLGDFILGEFEAQGKELREKGINRIGNILVPNNRYGDFENFFIPVLEKLQERQNATQEIITPQKLIEVLGQTINNEQSICYWAAKNKIPVFSPALTDGAMGDLIYFFKHKHPNFKLDIADDIKKLNDITMDAKKTGLILLGGGLVKHHITNSNMMRNGADYAVYINTSHAFDGSEAGAPPDEAVAWGKILDKEKSVKVVGDATILFPLIVAKCFPNP